MSLSKKRLIYAINGTITLVFLGLIYAWSIFVTPLEEQFSWSRSETSMAFTICMSCFCIGGFVAGMIAKKKLPSFIMRLCSLCVVIGFTMTSQINSLMALYITYGGFVGFGVGLGYNAIISSVTMWFPESKGFISGLLLMGFGIGGMLLGTAGTACIQYFGWRMAFMGIGVTLGILILISSFLVKLPESVKNNLNDETKNSVSQYEFSTKQMLATPSFWKFFLWAIVLSASGLAMIGHAVPYAIDMGVTPGKAAAFAGIISLFNGAGRVIIGAFFDKLGQRKTMMIVSLGFLITGSILIVSLKTENVLILIVGYALTGFSYGGIMPCNSTVVSTFYGKKNYALNFSIINMNIIFASMLGPYLAGVLHTMSGSYFTTFGTILLFSVIAFILNLLIKAPHRV